ncbi:MAG TPA: peptide chain release factor 2, partial [Nitrospinae bacterium]|nr:peptide chain release factor 2 [Nitrospinota bacterium]
MAELDKEIEKPNFWGDNERAQKILKEKSFLQKPLERWNSLNKALKDSSELISLLHGEEDTGMLSEVQT